MQSATAIDYVTLSRFPVSGRPFPLRATTRFLPETP